MLPSERRTNARIKIKVPVELHLENSDAPFRTATTDLSLHGCYIESMYPFPLGTVLEIKLQLTETLLVLGSVVTCDPQVGNGIQFTKMLPEDIEELRIFLDAAQTEAAEKEAENKEAADEAGTEE